MTIQKIEVHSPEAHCADLVAGNIIKLKALLPGPLTETTWDGKTTVALNLEASDLAHSLLANFEHIERSRSESEVLYGVPIKLGLDLCVPNAKQGIKQVRRN